MSLLNRLLDSLISIRALTNEFDSDTHLLFYSGVTLFYHLLTRKIIVIDMQKLLDLEQSIEIKYISEKTKHSRKEIQYRAYALLKRLL